MGFLQGRDEHLLGTGDTESPVEHEEGRPAATQLLGGGHIGAHLHADVNASRNPAPQGPGRVERGAPVDRPRTLSDKEGAARGRKDSPSRWALTRKPVAIGHG